MSIHTMLAIRLNAPEMNLSADEAKKLERAIKAVQAHYPMNVSQKHLDMGMLIFALGEIYGTRAVAIYMRRRNEGEQPAEPDRGEVLMPFPTRGARA